MTLKTMISFHTYLSDEFEHIPAISKSLMMSELELKGKVRSSLGYLLKTVRYIKEGEYL